MTNDSEKRAHRREQLISFKITEENGRGECFAAYATDISSGGIFISAINPRELGEQFYMTFEIPDTDIVVRCRCEIMWTRPFDPVRKIEPGYGVKFLDLPEDMAGRINMWVHFSKFSDPQE